jgi:tetratricopeptide (TPR) repeat protein
VDLEPEEAGHWLRLARAQAALGYQPAARESADRALALAPQSVDVVALAVTLDVMEGKNDAALARALTLRRQQPQDANAALLEGDIRSTLGQHAEAARAFGDSVRLKRSLAGIIRQAQASHREPAERPARSVIGCAITRTTCRPVPVNRHLPGTRGRDRAGDCRI